MQNIQSHDCRPIILIHGGAGKTLVSKFEESEASSSLQRIVNQGYEQLLMGVSAFQVVVDVVSALEDDPLFNAGTGAKIQSDGVSRLTASIMESEQQRLCGVMNLVQVKNPIRVASRLLDERDRVLSDEGALLFAREKGFEAYDTITEKSWLEWKQKSSASTPPSSNEMFGTVGAVVLDLKGKLAAGTSTGGKGMERAGRVSDSSTVAGNYATKKVAISTTGVGEEIVDMALAARIATRKDDGFSLDEAVKKTMNEFRERGGRGGIIAVDCEGSFFVSFTTQCMLYAVRTSKTCLVYPKNPDEDPTISVE